MPSLSEPTKLTYDDYRLLPDDGRRHEVLDGEHRMTAAPNLRHQRISMVLSWALESHLREHPRGQVFAAPCDVVLSRFDVVQPDLVFVSRERSAILMEDRVHGAPDLVVEIVSESSRGTDLEVKRKLYGRFGAQEYWVIDPAAETAAVCRFRKGRLQWVKKLSPERGDALTTPLLPELRLPLSTLFE